MTNKTIKTAGDFFIVDNSDDHWKALEYLRQWCELSSSIDIATGYFEIGALLALDGEWQKVDRIRILIGNETSMQTVKAIKQAQEILAKSLGAERKVDPFLTGLEAVVEGLVSGRIEVRVYRKKKFHAKAYITHGRLDVVGSAALVGSSNFTPPGLTRNVELNVRFTGLEVRELQDWFQAHWDEGEPVKAELLTVIEPHVRRYSPFEVYAKGLQVLAGSVEPGEKEWEDTSSRIYPLLAPYQRESYHVLKRRAAERGGAFLTDGVGLGKTFVGLMLTEYYAVRKRKNVLIMATKTGQDAVWEPELSRLLPDLTGEFTNVRVMAHTDLSTLGALDRVRQLAKRVDVVIIDEGHNFRNRGRQADDDGNPKSRWWRLAEICKGKTVFHLTATPINNTLFDLVHEFELFTGQDDAFFETLGVPSVRGYFSALERTFLDAVKAEAKAEADGGEPAISMRDFEKLLQQDKLLETLIVQNSRLYAKQSSIAAGAAEVLFPQPDMPRAVPYDYNLAYRSLLDELEKAFEKQAPLFVLPMYYPLGYSKDPDVDTKLENRQKQVVGLIRTTFLKRFESSIAAFAGSCADLALKIADWIQLNSAAKSASATTVQQWRADNAALLDDLHTLLRPGKEFEPTEPTDDSGLDEFDEDGMAGDRLDPKAFKVDEMIAAAFDDLAQLTSFMEQAVQVARLGDNKYDQLLGLLAGGKHAKGKDKTVFDPDFAKHKVLVFTEYADTARYLFKRLLDDGVADVDMIHGNRTTDRVSMIRRFAPFYNRVDKAGREKMLPLRVLVSTDVLSEGVNLQDASQIINYDIHWNPVRLMQRIGRVDRRLDEVRETAMKAENPSVTGLRGTVKIRNFLPPDDLNKILSLYSRVQGRTLLISKTLGIPGGRLLSEDDLLDDVKVFNDFMKEYMGDVSPVEALRLRFLEVMTENPGLEAVLDEMPRGAYSSRTGEEPGMFYCMLDPVHTGREDDDAQEWTLDPGRPQWLFVPAGESKPITDLARIDGVVRCEHGEPRLDVSDRVSVKNAVVATRSTRHEMMMKDAGLPLDAPSPEVICWMEVQP